MKVETRVTFFDDEGEKFFGKGPAKLLRAIKETGSLRTAAMSMNMAYTKALKLMKNAEIALGFPLLTRITGGRDGGGSTLTPEGNAWLLRYEAYWDACTKANQELMRKYFPNIGCVIMASGLSKRFGSNKLMADFCGRPMILQVLHVTEGVFQQRVVVTRHVEVAALCQEHGVRAVLHDCPHRSDTVRLGLEALGDVDACMFLPSDQPLLRRETLAEIIRTWELNQEKIVRPICNDMPGSPVLFPQWTFEELMTLPEGKGGNWVIKNHPNSIKTLEISNPYELMDADTPEILEILLQQIQKKE